MILEKTYPDFITITCLNWIPLLEKNEHKEIVVQSLAFLSAKKRISVFAFVIMHDHMHIIWKICEGNTRKDVQRDFLKFTAQQILKLLRNAKNPIQTDLRMDAADRKQQVWGRKSLSIPITSTAEFFQKANYIHNNPVKALYVKQPHEYYYSSADFFRTRNKNWDFLVDYHY